MAFLAHYGIWILIGAVVIFIGIGVPLYFFSKWYKIQKLGQGDFCLFLKVTPDGMNIQPQIKRYDRGKILDTKTAIVGGKEEQTKLTYTAPANRTSRVMFPLMGSKFFQVPLRVVMAVDGETMCLDLLTEFKIRTSQPTSDPRTNAQIVSQMLAQESGKTLLEATKPAGMSNFKMQGWMLIAAFVIAAIIVIFMGVMLMKINGGIGDLKSLLTVNPYLPGG